MICRSYPYLLSSYKVFLLFKRVMGRWEGCLSEQDTCLILWPRGWVLIWGGHLLEHRCLFKEIPYAHAHCTAWKAHCAFQSKLLNFLKNHDYKEILLDCIFCARKVTLKYPRSRCQGSKLTLANSWNASDFDNLRVRKISTSKRLWVRIINVSQTKGKNLLDVSLVASGKKSY